MDPSALKNGVIAHSKAINSVDSNGLCSQSDYADILKSIGHMIGSAGSQKSMAVYSAGLELIPRDSAIPKYLLSQVVADDAKEAYMALIEFSKVVRLDTWATGLGK